MSRYDAHEGVTNITIRNCAFGHQKVNLIGYGEALLENCKMSGPYIFALRSDYGSFWNGNITLKDCTWVVNAKDKAATFTANNTGDHDFGYPCAMPTVYTIDGLEIIANNIPEDGHIRVFTNYDRTFGDGNKPFPYKPTEKLILKNIRITDGWTLELAESPELLPGLEVIAD